MNTIKKIFKNLFFEAHKCWDCRTWRLRFILDRDVYCSSCDNKRHAAYVAKKKEIINNLCVDEIPD